MPKPKYAKQGLPDWFFETSYITVSLTLQTENPSMRRADSLIKKKIAEKYSKRIEYQNFVISKETETGWDYKVGKFATYSFHAIAVLAVKGKID